MKFPYQKSKLSIVDYSAGSGKGAVGSTPLKLGVQPFANEQSAPPKEPDELPDADSPEYAAWAAQNNETGRAENRSA